MPSMSNITASMRSRGATGGDPHRPGRSRGAPAREGLSRSTTPGSRSGTLERRARCDTGHACRPWVEPERLDLTDVDEPAPADGQALIQVSECGICGSDLSSFKGGLGTRPGQVLGHEFSGTVLAAPGVEGLSDGDRVTVRPLTPCGHCERCLAGDVHLCEAGRGDDIGYGVSGAFADRVLVPRALVGQTVFKLPDAVSDRAGALVEPLAVALRAARLAEPQPGDVAVVFGLGIIGLGAVHWLKSMGASTIVAADPSELRRERALALGADVVVDPGSESTVAAVAAITGPGLYGAGARADVVLDARARPRRSRTPSRSRARARRS